MPNTSKDEILRAIAAHQAKIARLRQFLNSLEVANYKWEEETPEQKMAILDLLERHERGE